MSKIVLHIGTHKTGTSHIQSLFRKNAAMMRGYGVVVPKVGSQWGQHELAGVWNDRFSSGGGQDALAVWKALSDAHSSGDETVFISSEELSRLQTSRRVDMAQMRALVDAFDEVRLVCTFRDQARFLQSVYQQIATNRHVKPWMPFLEDALETRFCDGLSIDYDRLYSHMLTGFARTEIRLLSYDQQMRCCAGMVGAMLREIGVDIPLVRFSPVGEKQSNISDPPLATYVASKISAPDVAARGLVFDVSETLRQVFGADYRGTMMTRSEIGRLETLFAPGNAALKRRISPYQPDFDIGPMMPGPIDITRDDLDENFWVEIARKVHADRYR